MCAPHALLLLRGLAISESPGGIGKDGLCSCKFDSGKRVCAPGKWSLSTTLLICGFIYAADILYTCMCVPHTWLRFQDFLLCAVKQTYLLHSATPPNNYYLPAIVKHVCDLLFYSEEFSSEVNPALILHCGSLAILCIFMVEVSVCLMCLRN